MAKLNHLVTAETNHNYLWKNIERQKEEEIKFSTCLLPYTSVLAFCLLLNNQKIEINLEFYFPLLWLYHQILLGWSIQGWCNGMDTQHVWYVYFHWVRKAVILAQVVLPTRWCSWIHNISVHSISKNLLHPHLYWIYRTIKQPTWGRLRNVDKTLNIYKIKYFSLKTRKKGTICETSA